LTHRQLAIAWALAIAAVILLCLYGLAIWAVVE
jgi:hypothetical protein